MTGMTGGWVTRSSEKGGGGALLWTDAQLLQGNGCPALPSTVHAVHCMQVLPHMASLYFSFLWKKDKHREKHKKREWIEEKKERRRRR